MWYSENVERYVCIVRFWFFFWMGFFWFWIWIWCVKFIWINLIEYGYDCDRILNDKWMVYYFNNIVYFLNGKFVIIISKCKGVEYWWKKKKMLCMVKWFKNRYYFCVRNIFYWKKWKKV